jgi:hypothetical protein
MKMKVCILGSVLFMITACGGGSGGAGGTTGGTGGTPGTSPAVVDSYASITTTVSPASPTLGNSSPTSSEFDLGDKNGSLKVQMTDPTSNSLKFFIKNPNCLSTDATYNFGVVQATKNSAASSTTRILSLSVSGSNTMAMVVDVGYKTTATYVNGHSNTAKTTGEIDVATSLTCANGKYSIPAHPSWYIITNGEYVTYYNGTEVYVGFRNDPANTVNLNTFLNFADTYTFSYPSYNDFANTVSGITATGHVDSNAQVNYPSFPVFNETAYYLQNTGLTTHATFPTVRTVLLRNAGSTINHIAFYGEVAGKKVMFAAFPTTLENGGSSFVYGGTTAGVNEPVNLGKLYLSFER